MSDISKEELSAFSETYSKINVLFEKILLTQEQLIERQEKITTRLYNGLAKDIADVVSAKIIVCNDKTVEKLHDIKVSMDSTDLEGSIASRMLATSKEVSVCKGYMDKAVWFIGIIGLAIIIVTSTITIIGRGIDNRKLFKAEIADIVKELVVQGVAK